MKRLRNLAELDYASTIHPLARELRDHQIRHARSPLRRQVARLINCAVTSAPSLSAKLLGGQQVGEVDVIGSGLHMIVIREGDSVIKIDQMSLLFSREALDEAVEKRRADHADLRQHLGDLVIPETVSTSPHPLLPHRQVLTVRQQFHPFYDPLLFHESSATPQTGAFARMSQTQPQAWDQLGAFLDGSAELFRATDSLPDTSRPGNLVVGRETGRLSLIDGQPILTGDPTQQIILQQLDAIREQLQAA